jgi:aryl-alcohol dehydrogenase-like predicted oxidoreductase
MEYIEVPGADLQVTRVCLGTWAIGGWMWGGTDEARSIKTIHAALDKGVNFIDTAPVYGFGASEEIVGKAVEQWGRDKVHIATKVALEWTEDEKVFRNSSRERIMKEIEDSLTRLRTDHVDVYIVHWPDPLVPFDETGSAMCEILESGKARAIGVSNYSPEQMQQFKAGCSIAFCQPPYNIFERQIEEDVKPFCERSQIRLMTYGALCRGLLTGKMGPDTTFEGDDLRKVDPKFQPPRYEQYLNAVSELENLAGEYGKSLIPFAVRWVLDQGSEVALWGGRAPEQMDPIPEVFGWKLDDEAMRRVDEILERTIADPVGPEFMAPPSRDNA